jgi:transcriptional regulator with XRE-family HTH domain
MISLKVNTFALSPYVGDVSKRQPTLDFPQHLAALRKERGLTQQALAERVGVHVVQLRRYESGASQPTLDVIRKLAMALSVSADLLLFGKDERGPDDELRLQFEAVSRFDPEEKKVIRSMLEGMILKHEARRWSSER